MEWKNLIQRMLLTLFQKFFQICSKHHFLISILHYNQRFRFSLCVINIYSKYAWVIPLKDKKRITITNAFQEIFDDSNCKPNKMWVDKTVNLVINQ